MMANKIHENNINIGIDSTSEKSCRWNTLQGLTPNLNEYTHIVDSVDTTKVLAPNSAKFNSIADSLKVTTDLYINIADRLNVMKDLTPNIATFPSITDSLKIAKDLHSNIADRFNITKDLIHNLANVGGITDSLKASTDLYLNIADRLNVMKDLTPNIATFASVTDSLKITKDLIPNLAKFDSITDSLKASTDLYLNIADRLNVRKDLNNAYAHINDIVNAIDINNININISEDDLSNEILINEAVHFVDETFNTIENDENWQQNVKDKVDKFKEANPVFALILAFLLTFLIQNVLLEPAMNYIKDNIKKIYSEDSSYTTRRKEVRKMFELNYPAYGEKYLNKFRYINKVNVSIKVNHYRNSYSVVTANKGTIVTLLNSKKNYDKRRFKNWLYVEYEAPDGAVYQGWINNLYTSKVR